MHLTLLFCDTLCTTNLKTWLTIFENEIKMNMNIHMNNGNETEHGKAEKRKNTKPRIFLYFQVRESTAPLNIPPPTPAPDRRDPVA